jgi:hypothetical protein
MPWGETLLGRHGQLMPSGRSRSYSLPNSRMSATVLGASTDQVVQQRPEFQFIRPENSGTEAPAD